MVCEEIVLVSELLGFTTPPILSPPLEGGVVLPRKPHRIMTLVSVSQLLLWITLFPFPSSQGQEIQARVNKQDLPLALGECLLPRGQGGPRWVVPLSVPSSLSHFRKGLPDKGTWSS